MDESAVKMDEIDKTVKHRQDGQDRKEYDQDGQNGQA